MKKIIYPVGMIVIGVLICVLAKGVDQRPIAAKKNVNSKQSELTYDKTEQERKSLPDREPDNNNLVALKTNLLPYGLPGRQKGWYGDLLAEKLGIEVHYVQPSYFAERDSDMDMYLFFMGNVSYYDAVKAGELLDLEPTLKKNPKIYKRYKNAFRYIKKYTYKKTGKKGIYGFPVNLKSFDDKGRKLDCVSILSGSNNKNKAMDLLMYSASDEGIMNWTYGPEGEMWERKNGKYVVLKDWSAEEGTDEDEEYVEYSDYSSDYICPRTLIYLIPNTSLGAELTGVKIKRF
ncbi:hypothetical protein DXB73_07470 [Clostridium sp. OM05-6BH]|uniref:hypothetical protein n=1 Tax=unclassified Clostridium TaxID=2614128 RepID=UPI000E4E891C|nr:MULTISPECIES: hypothetical protein [unclassified Clostridium]RHV15627.1 hypothetical protein DXB78_06315 [Clostridium sp. OM05-9BH]RHV19023.1 hypothetical protein DXB73_07470 [Clostridium sp. OM05-6BH]